jgi:RHS repeat-associated protein
VLTVISDKKVYKCNDELIRATFTGSYEQFYATTAGTTLSTTSDRLNISSSTSGLSHNAARILDKVGPKGAQYEVSFDLNIVSGTNFYLDVIADYESGGAVEDRHVFTSSGPQTYTVTATNNIYRLRLGTTSPATTPYNFNIDNLVIRRVDADSSYFIAEVVSAQDYSPFGAPLPGRSKTFTESASSSVISTESFTSGTNGWTSSGTHSVLTGNYYGQLAATITGRGSEPEGMQRTFATEEGKQYKVTFTINTLGWPSFRVQDSLSGDNILATGMQLPGTYSYTFVARGSRTTLYFEEIETVNSTLVLSSLIFSEEGKNSGYRYGFNQHEQDNELVGIANSTTTYWRQYDPRIARWLSEEPKPVAWENVYSSSRNNPVYYSDPNGDWVKGAGFFRNLFNSDAKILAQNRAAETGGTAFKDGKGWGVGYTINEIVNLGDGAQPLRTQVIEHFAFKRQRGASNTPFLTAISLLVNWDLGSGAEDHRFVNDRVANSFTDARVVNQARNYWYREVSAGRKTTHDGVTDFIGRRAWTGGNFGFKGLVAAGLDPIEQFVGSFSPTITSDGYNLTFTIQNTTSMKSFLYGIGPDWKRSTWGPGGNMTQTYIFTEPINFDRLKR